MIGELTLICGFAVTPSDLSDPWCPTEVADLTDEDAVLYLRAWDGQVKLVPQIKTRRFIRGRLEQAAANSASEVGQEMAAEAGSSGSDDAAMSDENC